MTPVQKDLLRIVYFSRNRITQSDDHIIREIDSILKVSQSNNARAGVTGALIFNEGVFGQVLEGSRLAVEETFERIQMDERHHDVTVLTVTAITERSFADWSMGYAGTNDLHQHSGTNALDLSRDIPRLGGEDIYQVLYTLALRNEASTLAV